MRAYFMVTISLVVLSGCEAPNDPAPEAPPDPIEEAIACNGLPEPVARVMRLLSSLPPDSSLDQTLAHLGLHKEKIYFGMSELENEHYLLKLSPGYRIQVAYH